MKKIIIVVISILSLSAISSDKFYYKVDGWFQSPEELAVKNGAFVDTPNGKGICEATIMADNGWPVAIDTLQYTDGKLDCPVTLKVETLSEIKTKKLADISAESLSQRIKQPYGEDYRINNVALGIYDETTTALIKAVHVKYRDNYYRLAALVNACTTEACINAITFTVE